MSYASEHRRMKALLDRCRELDIAKNKDPKAIFEPGSAGFQIWATPEDYPDDQVWRDALETKKMSTGAFSKPCAYVASVCWHWTGPEDEDGEKIVGFVVSTQPYFLRDAGLLPSSKLSNREPDIAWAIEKIKWLWYRAEYIESCPPACTEEQWDTLEGLEDSGS